MMRKILIWADYCYGSHTDIWRVIDYSKLFEEINMYYSGVVDNVGNKVWFQGLISEISTGENEISFRNPSESWDIINEKYDLIIYSAANLINIEHKKYIGDLADDFSHSKIPVYVISVGLQAKSYDDIYNLCDVIRLNLDRLIRVIYASGGEFGLRGYFTKEVFDMVSENTAEVIGCPSMYQNGPDLLIHKKKVSEAEFKPIVNGWSEVGLKGLTGYEKSVLIDQYEMFKPLYDSNFYGNMDDKSVLEQLVRRIGSLNVQFLLQGRIKLFCDIPQWRRFIISGGYSFSYGSRIHGNIMSILSGVPAVVYTNDLRTRELTEFYRIPHYTKEPDSTLYEEFLKVDYTEFNQTYKMRYEKYRQFLVSHNIVNDMNTNNIFWDKAEPKSNKVVETRLHRIKRLAEIKGNSHDKNIDIEKCNNSKFIIFGAGNLGVEAVRLLGETNVKYFIDNNVAKQATGYLGYKVLALDDLFIEKSDLIIIAVAEKYVDDIIEQLNNRRVKNYCTLSAIKTDLSKHFVSDRVD